MSKTVVGLFDNREHAETAARKVKEQGLRTDDISIVVKQREDGNTGGGFTNTAGTGAFGGTFSGIGGPGAVPVVPGGGADTPGGADDSGRTGGANGGRPVNDNISDGVVSGSVLGGIAGLVIGAGSLIVPGLGIIAAAGPIAGLLSGAVTGGVVGGLIDLGIPEKESRQLEGDIKQGKILFSMKTDEDKVDRILSILKSSGATNTNAY